MKLQLGWYYLVYEQIYIHKPDIPIRHFYIYPYPTYGAILYTTQSFASSFFARPSKEMPKKLIGNKL